MADRPKIEIVEADIVTKVSGLDVVKKSFDELFNLAKDRVRKMETAFEKIKLMPDVNKQKSELQNLFRVMQIQSKDLKNALQAANKELQGLKGDERKSKKIEIANVKQIQNELKSFEQVIKQYYKVVDGLSKQDQKVSNERQKQWEKDWKTAEKWVQQNITSKQKEADQIAKTEEKFLQDLQRGAEKEVKIEEQKQKEIDRLRKMGEKSMDEFDLQAFKQPKIKEAKGVNFGQIGQILTSTFSRIGSILGALGIVNSLNGIVDALKKATDAALDFAQAEYTLSVQVEAAQKVLGTTAAGTLTDWKKKIQELRKELAVYSETDITKAVSQTSVLTRVLGLNAEQQEQVIRIAATLAQTTGVDLSQAVDDVTKALGGSSVVLDKYGLFIRDADKGAAAFELGFTDKVLKGTQSLNSQQLALATLKTVFDQVEPLANSLGGFEDTLPGRLKAADAAIADHTKNVGGMFVEINSLFKNLYADFLQYVENVSKNFKPLLDFVEQINSKLEDSRKLQQDIGEKPNILKYASGGIRGIAENTGLRVGMAEPENGYSEEDIRRFQKNHLITKEEGDRYLRDLAIWLEKRNKLVSEKNQQALQEQRKGEQTAGGVSGNGLDFGNGDEMTDEAEKIEKLTRQYGLQIVDAWLDYKKQKEKARADSLKADKKANDDEVKAIEDLNKKTNDAIRDLIVDGIRKRQDIDRKHENDLLDLERDTNQKREDIDKDFQEKSIKATEDYYDALQKLEDQYYFDLRDAVADNDAVAIKRLERKFNLDKKNLENGLNDQQDEEQSSYTKRIEELEQDTANRKDELNRRYEQELDELNIQEIRKREDIARNHDEELIELQEHYDEVRDEIASQYQAQRDEIDLAYRERLTDIIYNLSEEENINRQFLDNLLQMYAEYLGIDGVIPSLVGDFYTRQQQMSGNLTTPLTGQLENIPEGLGLPVQNYNPLAGSVQVEVSLNSDMLENAIVTTTGDIIQDVMVRPRGTIPGRM